MTEYHSETGEIVGTYRRSAELNELFTALAKAQAKFDAAKKAGKGNFGKYPTLESVLDATAEGREQNSLALIQMPSNGTGTNISVTTLLGHSSGQWIESTFAVAPTKFDAQGAGSAVTYLRRYSAMAILGVAPEDDDGEAASIQPATKGATRAATPRPPAAIPNATSAGASPGSSFTGNGEPPQWIPKFLTRENYEIDPVKAGGWSAWEKTYTSICDHAQNLDQILKLENDNAAHFPGFRQAVKEPVYQNLRARIESNEKRLWRAPVAAK